MADVTDSQPQPLDDNQTSFRETLLKQHNENIRDANGRATRVYQQFFTQMKFAFWLTIGAFVTFCIMFIIVLSVSLYHAFQPTNNFVQYFGAAVSALSAFLVFALIYNNPLKLARKSMAELIKINVIYMGYTRQIYQIDAEFKKALLETGASKAVARDLAKQIQTTTDETISTLTISMGEFSE